MDKELKLQRGLELQTEIAHYDFEYYVLDNPTISDKEYDRKLEEYAELEKEFPELKTPFSPTQRVGSEPLSKLEKYTHKTPLLSIDQKAKTIEALTKYYDDCGGEGTEVIIQPKYDGLTENVNYEPLKDTLLKSDIAYMEASIRLGERGSFLVNAATRGNGYIGELVTESVKTIKSVPLSIPYNGSLEVRGEGIIYYQDFVDKFMAEGYSNPRNLAAGTFRQLDPKLTAARKPDIVFYDIGQCDKEFANDIERLEFLKEQGFKVTPYKVVNNLNDLIDTCFSYFDGNIKIKNGFNVLDMPGNVTDIVCDGLVLKVSDLKLREELGMTSKGPKWAFAFKFKSLTAITYLSEVAYQVGRTGKITPVANFKEVNLGGANTKKATLNNEDYMKNIGPTPLEFITNYEIKDGELYITVNKKMYLVDDIKKVYAPNTLYGYYILHTSTCIPKCDTCFENDRNEFAVALNISEVEERFNMYSVDIKEINEYIEPEEYFYLQSNDCITIERSNDVIPSVIGINYLDRPVDENNNMVTEELVFPTHCPTCGTELEVIYPQRFCTNINCVDRLKGSITHYACRDAMDITGLGESIAEKFVDLGFLKSITDIYKLKDYEQNLIALDGFGKRKVQKLFDAIEATKTREFWRFLYSLGIEEVGKSTSKNLVKHFKSIDALINATEEELKSIEDIGDVATHSIISFFKNEKNMEVIQELREIGINMEDNTVAASNIFSGMSFVITGTLYKDEAKTEKIGRDAVKKIIEDNGGKDSSSVSKKTSVVIIGEDAGSKQEKALELVSKGNPIIILEGYNAFEDFLNKKTIR